MRKILIELQVDWEGYDDVCDELVVEDAIQPKSKGVGWQLIKPASPVNGDFFNIILDETGEVVSNVQKLSKRSDITDKTKLYYELGYKKYVNRPLSDDNWIRTGKFKEIKDPIEIKEKDNMLDDSEYISHHNFVFKEI